MKNRILTIALALGASSGLTVTAMAQDAQTAPPPAAAQERHQPPDPAKQAHRFAKRLNLTADQESQLVTIFANRNQQMTAIHTDTTMSREDRHAKMLSLRQDTDAKVKSILNDSQKAQYDALEQQMQSHQRVRPAQ